MTCNEFFCSDVSCFERGVQAQRWFVYWFVGELEGAPVHRDGFAASAFDKGLDGFFGIHVHRLHDAAGSVRTDGDHAEIDRPVTHSNFMKGGAIACVTRMPEFAAGILDQPSAPVAEVTIPWASCGKMLRWCGSDYDLIADCVFAVPGDLDDIAKALFRKPMRMTLRRDQAHLCAELS